MKGKTGLIAGATGLIGRELLSILLEAKEYERIVAIVRSPLHIDHPKLQIEQVNFDKLECCEEIFEADDVFCCLGTTIKKAGTKEEMYKVDVDYPLTLAKMAIEKGAKHYLLVSSMNANPDSFIWYSKIKGTIEKELARIPFDTISIFRPSLLLGRRKEFRVGEQIGAAFYKGLSFIFKGPLRKYKAIQAKNVALAMYLMAQTNRNGVSIYESEEIEELVMKSLIK